MTRAQLLDLGLGPEAIKHRITKGRMHPVWRGVYAVGRPQLTQHGRWMAAVLCCGPSAALSHESAAALWQIRDRQGLWTEVSVPRPLHPRPPGIRVHRRVDLVAEDLSRRQRIAVTGPIATLVDLAARLPYEQLEAAVNKADKHDLVDPETLRAALEQLTRRPGLAVLRGMLDRRTFALTDSELERRFLPLARRAGLPLPQTRRYVNGFKVDFFWPELGLIVETDGLRYHRTAAQQAKDRLRDQTHAVAGLTPLRFTHAQVIYETKDVQAKLAAVAARLRDRSASVRGQADPPDRSSAY